MFFFFFFFFSSTPLEKIYFKGKCPKFYDRGSYVTSCEIIENEKPECLCEDELQQRYQQQRKRQFFFTPAPVHNAEGVSLTVTLCSLVNEYRIKNGLPSVPLSRTMEHVALEHAKNLYLYYQFTPECNPHSWMNDTMNPSKQTWKECCYPRDYFCMSKKGVEMSSVWPSVYNFKGLSWENLFYGIPNDVQTAFDAWKKSPGHNALMLSGAQNCAAAGAGLYVVLWMGNQADPLGYNPIPNNVPTLFPTLSPTQFPTFSPSKSPSKNPTFNPTKSPSKSPTTLAPTRRPTSKPTRSPFASHPGLVTVPPGTFASPTCNKLESECWSQCDNPQAFYFQCRSGWDPFPVRTCVVPFNCSCIIPNIYPTESENKDKEDPPTECSRYQCPLLISKIIGSENWCTECLANCNNSLSTCIEEFGLCSTRCTSNPSCVRFRNSMVTIAPTAAPVFTTSFPTKITTTAIPFVLSQSKTFISLRNILIGSFVIATLALLSACSTVCYLAKKPAQKITRKIQNFQERRAEEKEMEIRLMVAPPLPPTPPRSPPPSRSRFSPPFRPPPHPLSDEK